MTGERRASAPQADREQGRLLSALIAMTAIENMVADEAVLEIPAIAARRGEEAIAVAADRTGAVPHRRNWHG